MATRLHITTEYLEPSADRWDSAYTTVNTTSSDWDSSYTWVINNSADAQFSTVSALSLSGTFFGDGSNLIGASLPGQADLNTVVRAASGNWNNGYNTGLVFQGVSGSYTTFQYVNSSFLPLSGGTINGPVSIAGNLFVTGTATYINVTDFQVSDPLIYLGIQNQSDILDIGFIGVYRPVGDSVEHRHVGLIRNHQDKKWLLFSNLSACPLSGIGPNPKLDDPSIIIDTLRANLEGNLTTNTTVSGNLNVQGELSIKNSNGYRVARFESLAGYPLEIHTADEGLEAGYSATRGSIGRDPDGLKVYYGTNLNGTEWGEVLYLDRNKDGSIARNKLSLNTAALMASGSFVSTTNYQNASGNWENTYTTVKNNSATNWNYQGTDLKALTGKYENTFTTVQSNSSTNWNYQGTDLKQLSANWQSTYLSVSALSATWNLPSTDLNTVANYLSTNNIIMQTVSAISLSGTFFGNGSNLTGLTLPGQQNINTVVQSNSANWNSVYTTVLSNSATTWNYQGTDVKALTSKYENTFTTVQSNSGNWNTAYNVATAYSSISSTFATRNFVDNKFLPLSGGNLTGELSGTTIKLTNTTFTGKTVQAISLTGTNLFVEIEISGGIKKYLQLFDIEQPLTTYFVDFEDGTKGSYGSGNVILNGLSWNMTECLIGTLSQDWKNGLRSARLRGFTNSEMTMLQDKTGGIGTITFFYSRYATDAQVQWIVEYSINGGVTWIPVGTFTADGTVQQFTAVVNQPSSGRIRIRHNSGGDGSTNRRTNVDNITITGVIT